MRIRESSADSRCETDGVFLYTLTASVSPTSSSYNNKLDNPSADRRNKYRDNRSPCRSPLEGGKHLYLRIKFDLISTWPNTSHHKRNPTSSKPQPPHHIFQKNPLKYALCISSLTAHVPFCPYLLFLIRVYTYVSYQNIINDMSFRNKTHFASVK
jgi:hypothetical protein